MVASPWPSTHVKSSEYSGQPMAPPSGGKKGIFRASWLARLAISANFGLRGESLESSWWSYLGRLLMIILSTHASIHMESHTCRHHTCEKTNPKELESAVNTPTLERTHPFSVPRTYIAAHNSSSRDLMPSSNLLRLLYTGVHRNWYTHTQLVKYF